MPNVPTGSSSMGTPDLTTTPHQLSPKGEETQEGKEDKVPLKGVESQEEQLKGLQNYCICTLQGISKEHFPNP